MVRTKHDRHPRRKQDVSRFAILAAKSTVFRDMIAFPQLADRDAEKMDGFPVVQLHDSAEDVEVFLRAIFDSRTYTLFFVCSFRDSSLFSQYGKTYYDDDVTNHLTVEDLDEGEGEDEDPPSVALWIIFAAVEVYAHWLLPYAYYCAAMESTEDLLFFTDGKMAPYALKVLALHAHLVRGMVAIAGSLAVHAQCSNAERYDRARDSALSRLFDIMSEDAVDPLPSKTYFEDEKLPQLAAEMCGQCIGWARFRQHAAASAFWDRIPGVLGLQLWEDLHAMAEAAMGDDPDEEMRH
ncbi:hypothetical protein C8R45DRAFT_1223561 [Mycena sanguinolenta]|nr:hypothetical protein C8R45DRAFT_1223561 [Mycena sanguinolenta]